MNTALPRFGWGQIAINVRDLDRSIAFYRKLGFETFIPSIPYTALSAETSGEMAGSAATALGLPAGTTGRACILQLDDGFPKIDLTEVAAPDPSAPLTNADTGLVRFCLITGDLAAEVAALKAEGVAFLSEPQTAHDGLAEMVVCKDPDGTLIELLQVHLDRWAPYLG